MTGNPLMHQTDSINVVALNSSSREASKFEKKVGNSVAPRPSSVALGSSSTEEARREYDEMMGQAGRPNEMAMHTIYDDNNTMDAALSTHNPMNASMMMGIEEPSTAPGGGIRKRNLGSLAVPPKAPKGPRASATWEHHDEFDVESEAGLNLDENGYDELGGFYDEQGMYVSPFREGADNEQSKLEAEAAAARYRAAKGSEKIPETPRSSLTGYENTIYSKHRIRGSTSDASVVSALSSGSSKSKKRKSKKKHKERENKDATSGIDSATAASDD